MNDETTSPGLFDGLPEPTPIKPEIAFVFLDCETTGLRPNGPDGIRFLLEVAIVAVDRDLNPVREISRLIAIDPDALSFDPCRWDEAAWQMHQENNLYEECRTYGLPLETAEQHLIGFMSGLGLADKPPMCGNSMKLDRDFLEAWMPRLYGCFSYRTTDVSSIRGALVGLGLPDYTPDPGAEKVHRASADCLASIEQLRFYRDRYFQADALRWPQG